MPAELVTDRAALEQAYLALSPEGRQVFDWCIKVLGFKVRGRKELPKGKSLWVFHAPGTGGVHDQVELTQKELRWRHVFGLATTYDYNFSIQVKDLYADYVQQQCGQV